MKITHLDSRDEWLKARKTNHSIGGSTVAAILGISPFAGPWDVYAERVLGQARDFSKAQQVDVDRGRRWEGLVLDEYEALTGRRVYAPRGEWLIEHPHEAWAVGTPDGLVVRDPLTMGAHMGGVEAKLSRNAHEWGEHEAVIERWDPSTSGSMLPPYYATQAYWYLEVTGLPWWDFAVAIPRSHDFPEVRRLRLMRDEATQQRLLATVKRWRWRHLVNGEAPDPDHTAGCRRTLDRMWSPADKEVHDADDDEADLMTRLSLLKGQQRELERDIDHTEARLAWRMGDRYGLRIPGSKARVLWIPMRGRTTCDLDRLRADFPQAAEACLGQGEPSRSFRLYDFHNKPRS